MQPIILATKRTLIDATYFESYLPAQRKNLHATDQPSGRAAKCTSFDASFESTHLSALVTTKFQALEAAKRPAVKSALCPFVTAVDIAQLPAIKPPFQPSYQPSTQPS